MAIMKSLFPVLSTVNGVTMDNPDGTNRQDIIANIKTGETILFHAEPWNKYDSEAIRLATETGKTVGYLPAKTKAEREFKSMVFESMKRGEIIGYAIRKPQEKPWYSLGLYVKFYFAPNEMFAERMLPEATAWKPERSNGPQKRKSYEVSCKYKGKDARRRIDLRNIERESPERMKRENRARRNAFKRGEDIKPSQLGWHYGAYISEAEALELFKERKVG